MQKLAGVDVTFGIYIETYRYSLISDYAKKTNCLGVTIWLESGLRRLVVY